MNYLQHIKAIFFSVILFFALTSVASAATGDYVHYWTFDEGEGRSISDVAGGVNGTITGSSTGFGWASGKSGTALGMDGVSGEAIVFPSGILTGSAGTLSLWFKMNSLSERNILFSGKSDVNNNIYVALSVDKDGRPQLQFRETSSGADRRAQGITLLKPNEWYNLVLTANGQIYHMYINGEEINVSGSNTGRWFPDMVTDTLRYNAGALDALPLSGVLNGYIDDIRIYGRALSLDEVVQLYNEINTAKSDVPIGVRPSLSFSISSDTIPFGGSVMLKWSSMNVSECSTEGDWHNSVDTSGSIVFIKLAANAEYVLSCRGKGGVVAQTTRVRVLEEGERIKDQPASPKEAGLVVTEESTSISEKAKMSDDIIRAQIDSLMKQVQELIKQLQEQLDLLKKMATAAR